MGTRSSREFLKIIYTDLDHIMPESQRTKKQQQKATGTQKHTRVCPLTLKHCSCFDNGSSNPPPPQTTCPRKSEKKLPLLSTGLPSNFYPPDQKIEKKKKSQPNISFKAAVAMLFSLQRQDKLFRSLRQVS